MLGASRDLSRLFVMIASGSSRFDQPKSVTTPAAAAQCPAGTSLCRWIKQARLDHCAADLSNPDLRERSITEIAFGWGFNDAAHFSRTFRAEFGMAPREYRSSAFAMRSARDCLGRQ
jgi:methylphosphotriester-DNA--protein-cysteine methyltransferase